MDERIKVILSCDQPLDLVESYNYVQSPKCGAINIFSGTIRDDDLAQTAHGDSTTKPIRAIHYEAYEPMAKHQIMKIAGEARIGCSDGAPEDGNTRICVAVRLGDVPVGESSIMICASSTRRAHSHQLVMSILQRIKCEVVIWKKILFADGTAHWDSEGKSEASWLPRKSKSTKL